MDSRTQYSEASAASLGVGNKGHTPDPPQQNPTGRSSEHKWLWKVDGSSHADAGALLHAVADACCCMLMLMRAAAPAAVPVAAHATAPAAAPALRLLLRLLLRMLLRLQLLMSPRLLLRLLLRLL